MSEFAHTHENFKSQFELAKRGFRNTVVKNEVLQAVVLGDEVGAVIEPYFRSYDYGIIVTKLETGWSTRKLTIDRYNHHLVPIIDVAHEGAALRTTVAESFTTAVTAKGFFRNDAEAAARVFEEAAFQIRNTLPQNAVRLDRNFYVWKLVSSELA